MVILCGSFKDAVSGLTQPMTVWAGHSCPTLLGLILGVDSGSQWPADDFTPTKESKSEVWSQDQSRTSKSKVRVKGQSENRNQNRKSKAADKGVRPTQFFFRFRFLPQYWFRFDHDFLTQSVEQRIKDNLEGLRVLGQHAFHAFAMHRQFSDGAARR